MSHLSHMTGRRKTSTYAAMAASGMAWLIALYPVIVLNGGVDDRGRAQTPATGQDEADYGYGPRYLNDAQRAGRDTWYFWTGGNEKFWVKMAELTEGNVNLLAYVDSRLHGRRFATLGAITQPGCQAATGPDQYGLWMDKCDQPPVPGVPGEPSGHRRPAAVSQSRSSIPANWNAEEYFKHPGKMEPPYLIGMACGFCHIGFNPLNPPQNPERRSGRTSPARSATSIGKKGGCSTCACRRPTSAGTSATVSRPARRTRRASRPITSTTRTRSTSIFNLAYRPTADGADGRRHDAPGASHPQGRRRFDRRRRARRCASTSTSACARTTG